LCDTYEGSSEIKSSRKNTYNRQYQTFCQKPGEFFDDCFARFKSIVSRLRSCDPLAYFDNERAKQLLYALDDSVWGMKIIALEKSALGRKVLGIYIRMNPNVTCKVSWRILSTTHSLNRGFVWICKRGTKSGQLQLGINPLRFFSCRADKGKRTGGGGVDSRCGTTSVLALVGAVVLQWVSTDAQVRQRRGGSARYAGVNPG
jgi:hypothetical protein